MFEWFKNLDPAVQAAVITGVCGVLGTIVAGVFTLLKKGNNSKSGINIKQTQKGKNNTQIGIQNNYGNEMNKNE